MLTKHHPMVFKHDTLKNTLKRQFRLLHASVIILLFFVPIITTAQELRCNVSVVTPSIQGTNRKVFETMQTALNEFMNSQRWTDKIYATDERIECNIMINIKETVSIDEFKGTIQIQARRPVYQSSYYTTLFNHIDQNFHVTYVENEPLIYNPNSFESNLIGLMAYYAYVIIGMDEDSYSLMGGTSTFQKAEQLVNQAQGAKESGWKSYENTRNRYWLVENMLNEYHKPLRECMYKYHRLGMDKMAEKVEAGRTEVATGLELLRKVYRQKPGSFLLQVFFTAKADEIVNIFAESYPLEKENMTKLLTEIDPTNQDKYKKINADN